MRTASPPAISTACTQTGSVLAVNPVERRNARQSWWWAEEASMPRLGAAVVSWRCARGGASAPPIADPGRLPGPGFQRVSPSGLRHRRDDDDLDARAGHGDADLAAIAGRGGALRNPCVPDLVDLVIVVHVVEPERGLQQVPLVGARLLQKRVDPREAALGLRGDGVALADLAGQIDDAIMAQYGAGAGLGSKPFDGHGSPFSSYQGSAAVLPGGEKRSRRALSRLRAGLPA